MYFDFQLCFTFLNFSFLCQIASVHGLLRALILRALLESNQTTNFRLQSEYASMDDCAQQTMFNDK